MCACISMVLVKTDSQLSLKKAASPRRPIKSDGNLKFHQSKRVRRNRSPTRPRSESLLEAISVVFLVDDTLFFDRELICRANGGDAIERNRRLVVNAEDLVLTGVVGKAALCVVLSSGISIESHPSARRFIPGRNCRTQRLGENVRRSQA